MELKSPPRVSGTGSKTRIKVAKSSALDAPNPPLAQPTLLIAAIVPSLPPAPRRLSVDTERTCQGLSGSPEVVLQG